MTTPFRLDGRIALVTGGASGIGEATCRAFTAAGASVIVADVDQPRADVLASQLPRSSVLILDICDEGAVKAALARIPKLDILASAAFTAPSSQDRQST